MALTAAVSSFEPIALGIVVLLIIVLVIARMRQGRDPKPGKGGSAGYPASDVAQTGDPTSAYGTAQQPAFAAASPNGSLGTPAPPPSSAVPAGWLPDPSGDPNAVRYWDGSTWTEHIARRS